MVKMAEKRELGDRRQEHSSPLCKFCKKVFVYKRNLIRHLRRKHNAEVEANSLTERKIKCSHEGCAYSFHWMKELRLHLNKVHRTLMFVDSLHFLNKSEFLKWKEAEEIRSTSSFVSFRKKSPLKGGGSRQILSCHRSGHYSIPTKIPIKNGHRASKKIGRACPAGINMTESPSGDVQVLYYKTHVGHALEVESLPLTKEDKTYLACLISQGFSFDAILDEVKESSKGDSPKRIHFLSRKDLHNITKSSTNGANAKKNLGQMMKNVDTGKFGEVTIKQKEPPSQRRKGGMPVINPQVIINNPGNQFPNTNQFMVVPPDLNYTASSQLLYIPQTPQVVNIAHCPSTSPIVNNIAPFQTKTSNKETPTYTTPDGSRLVQGVEDKLNVLRERLNKVPYLTPKRYATLMARLEGAVDVLESCPGKPKRRKGK